jgi:4-amino-4-deoxy-L-arabinose transferase-like glycosyltransferase
MPYPEVLARWERAGWVFAARVFNVFVSTFSIYLTYLVGKNLYNRNVGILAAFLQSFNWMLIRVDSAAFWETPGTMFILATLAVFTMPMKNMKLKVGLSGFLLGCAFSSRFPMGLFLIPFVGFFAWKKQWSQLTTFLVGFSIMTLVEGVVQYIVGHGFFGATLTFFTFNVVTMESAKFWGASPWYTYIEALVSNLGVTIYLVIFSLKKDEMSFLLSSMIILYLAVFSYVQHKEPRYITCLIPLLCPLMAAGAFKIERNYAILFILPYFIYNLAVIIFW